MKISPSRFISMKNFKQVMLAIVYLFQILTKGLKQKCKVFSKFVRQAIASALYCMQCLDAKLYSKKNVVSYS